MQNESFICIMTTSVLVTKPFSWHLNHPYLRWDTEMLVLASTRIQRCGKSSPSSWTSLSYPKCLWCYVSHCTADPMERQFSSSYSETNTYIHNHNKISNRYFIWCCKINVNRYCTIFGLGSDLHVRCFNLITII